LSRSADKSLDEHESRVSGNNLWAVAVDFLSPRSGRGGNMKLNGVRETNLVEEPTPSGSSADIHSDGPRVAENKFLGKLFHGH